jgi:hypothetical protein
MLDNRQYRSDQVCGVPGELGGQLEGVGPADAEGAAGAEGRGRGGVVVGRVGRLTRPGAFDCWATSPSGGSRMSW